MKDKLEIFIITYNRAKYLKNTLKSLFEDNSPLKNCDITVINNNSIDATDEICCEYLSKFHNFHYVKNRYNIGFSDITQAYFMSTKEYIWVLADDDYLDFSHFSELKEAINRGDDTICCCRHILDTPQKANNLSDIFIQLTLVSAGIYRRSIFDDTCMKNMHENNYTMFPHMVLVVTAINKGLKITVLEHEILKIGIHTDETDCSYNRGSDEKFVFPRNKNMNWICGFANICSGLHDKNFAHDVMRTAISKDFVYGSIDNFVVSVINSYRHLANWGNLADIISNVDKILRHKLIFRFLYVLCTSKFKNLFKVKNEK